MPVTIGEIETELRRTVTPRSLTVIPADPRVLRAVWEGVPVPRGKFSKAVAGLAAQVVPSRVGA